MCQCIISWHFRCLHLFRKLTFYLISGSMILTIWAKMSPSLISSHVPESPFPGRSNGIICWEDRMCGYRWMACKEEALSAQKNQLDTEKGALYLESQVLCSHNPATHRVTLRLPCNVCSLTHSASIWWVPTVCVGRQHVCATCKVGNGTSEIRRGYSVK